MPADKSFSFMFLMFVFLVLVLSVIKENLSKTNKNSVFFVLVSSLFPHINVKCQSPLLKEKVTPETAGVFFFELPIQKVTLS